MNINLIMNNKSGFIKNVMKCATAVKNTKYTPLIRTSKSRQGSSHHTVRSSESFLSMPKSFDRYKKASANNLTIVKAINGKYQRRFFQILR